jgi:predicted dehydrogenase
MSSRLKWRLDPAVGGPSHVLGDIGTHAHQLLTYVSGQRVAAVLADVGAALPGRTSHDTAGVILRMRDGARTKSCRKVMISFRSCSSASRSEARVAERVI